MANYGMDYQGGGGGGGFGGGGFGESSQTSGGGNRGGGGGGARKSYDEQTIIPCTIGMITSATPEGGSNDNGSLELQDGRRLHHVTIIGAIREHNENSTNVVYEIEDGTGLITVKQWVDQNDCAGKYEMRKLSMMDHIYVKVVGSPKFYDGHVQLIAESVRPLSSGNELTCHFLEVVYCGERAKQKNGGLFGSRMGGVGYSAPAMRNHNSMSTPLQSRSGGTGGVFESVLNYIKDQGQNREMGVQVREMVSFFQQHHSEIEIRKAVEELAAEGHIYSTTDEEHYQFAM